MERNMKENFNMEWNMEWKIFSMEWKWNGRKLSVRNKEKSSSIPFHTMPGTELTKINQQPILLGIPNYSPKALESTRGWDLKLVLLTEGARSQRGTFINIQ